MQVGVAAWSGRTGMFVITLQVNTEVPPTPPETPFLPPPVIVDILNCVPTTFIEVGRFVNAL